MSLAEWMATIGVGVLLLAFLLMTLNLLSRRGVWYALLNLVGAAMACYASVLIDFVPFVILEGCWALVAAFALLKTFYQPSYPANTSES